MNIENITSNEMGLSNNGRFMQIEIYEKEIKRLQQELQRKDNIIKDAKEVLLTTSNIEKALNVLGRTKELEESK